jgi:hypothetical protein
MGALSMTIINKIKYKAIGGSFLARTQRQRTFTGWRKHIGCLRSKEPRSLHMMWLWKKTSWASDGSS